MQKAAPKRGELSRLNPVHVTMALMVTEGYSNKEIARTLSLHETRVSQIRASPLFRLQVERLTAELKEKTLSDIGDRITQKSRRAFERIDELMENWDGEVPHSVQLQAAKEFTDRTHPKVNLSAGDHQTRVLLDKESVALIASVMSESGIGRSYPAQQQLSAPIPADYEVEEAKPQRRSFVPINPGELDDDSDETSRRLDF